MKKLTDTSRWGKRTGWTAVMILGVISAIALGVSGCSKKESASDQKPKTPQPFDIGMVTFPGYAPLYLAKEKGFFGDLDVRLQRIEEIPSIRAAVVKGDLEAYLATPDIAFDTNIPAPGKAVWAVDESAGGDGVVVSSDIGDITQLKGRKVAGEPGFPPYFIMLYLLHQHGLGLNDIQFQDMTTQNAATAFVSKAVDAAAIYEPYLSQAEGQRAGSKVVVSSAQTPGLIVDLIFARDDVVASRPNDIKQLIAGWRKAIAFIRQSPDEANLIMAASFNLPVNEFKDIASGVRWLDLDENRQLYGTPATPGPLFSNFGVVVDVLRRNRPEVFKAESSHYLIREFISEAK